MKIRNKLIAATALTALSGIANAAVIQYTIFGGNWDSIQQWNNNANGVTSTLTYDNGATPSCVGIPDNVCWGTNPAPGAMNGTFGGTLLVDSATNAVVGGQLQVTGSIADQIVIVGVTQWVRQFNDLVIDFETSTATTSSNQCFASISAFSPCSAVVNANTQTSIFAPLTGIASQDPSGAGGLPFLGSTFATFNATSGELVLFRNGRNPAAPTGTDVLNRFTLQVVPVPAAVWLFGSALGLLAVGVRKVAA